PGPRAADDEPKPIDPAVRSPLSQQPPAPEPSLLPLPRPNEKAPLDVEMRATETTWIRVSTDGGAVDLAGETLQPGDTRRYTAEKTIELKVGNAGGLALVVNNHNAPTLGRRDEVRHFMITPENAAQLNFLTP